MTGDDTRERMKRLMQQFEASNPQNDDRTRGLRWRWLVADVAMEKGRADGEHLAAAWLTEMEKRAAA